MSDTPTANALAAQAALAAQSSPVFAPDFFDGTVFDTGAQIPVDARGVRLSEVALEVSMDPTDPYEVARLAGGQGSIRATTGLTAAEIAAYPFGSHNPTL